MPRPLTPSKRDTTATIDVRPLADEPLLHIENLRVETAPAQVPEPSALLTFDMLNRTALPLKDVVVRVSFVEKHTSNTEATPAQVVVGPVTVLVKETIEAGYVLRYEMLFRNLSSDCDCTPRVEVLSARLLPD